jgi:hypothetical protein
LACLFLVLLLGDWFCSSNLPLAFWELTASNELLPRTDLREAGVLRWLGSWSSLAIQYHDLSQALIYGLVRRLKSPHIRKYCIDALANTEADLQFTALTIYQYCFV